MKLERRPLIPRAELRRGISECVAQGRELLGWLVDPHGAVHTRQAPEDRKDFEPECCPIRHNVHWRWRLRFEGDRKGKPHKHGDSRPLEKDGRLAKHWTSHGSGGKRDNAFLSQQAHQVLREVGNAEGCEQSCKDVECHDYDGVGHVATLSARLSTREPKSCSVSASSATE